jgi:hypothetical protein
VDHFVGTASVVAATGGRPAVVRAALLHNAYRQAGVNAKLRDEVRQVIGAEAEGLVFAHQTFPWDAAAVRGLLGRVDEVRGQERDLVVIRIANEVDDLADLGRLHSGQVRLDLGPVVELAEGLGESHLAAALTSAVAAEDQAVEVEPGLVSPGDRPVLVPSRSHRPRLRLALRSGRVRLRRLGRRAAGRLRRR